jgi:sugar lactone lactonase YvrE
VIKNKNIVNLILASLVLLLFCCHPPKPVYSHSPKIVATGALMTTIAGNGTPGYAGDGGAASQAELYAPSGIAIDFEGNIYIADRINNRIRKIAAETGIISTLAGNGTMGYTGDGTAAYLAELNNPSGVAVDGSGNIYIADTGNHCIRKVTVSTGFINTIAGTGIAGFGGDGGQASSAYLHNPSGVCVDMLGNVFIADLINNRIRKIVGGIISTIAGGGTCASGSFCGDSAAATAAALYAPMGVTVDASGNIYIADTGNDRVRMVAASSGSIFTIVGTGHIGFSGDGGQATSAQLYSPYGVVVDGNGNLYVADNLNNRIREVEAGIEIIETIAGNGIGSYAGDNGIATAASLYNPYSIALDGAGNIYIADCNNHRIRRFN